MYYGCINATGCPGGADPGDWASNLFSPSLKSLFSGTLSTKKVVVWGNSTVSNATEFFQELATHCGPSDALSDFTCSPELDSSGLPVTIGNIYNYGNNGFTLAALISNTGGPPYPLSSVVSAAPDLIIERGPIINDVRNGLCDLSCAEGLLSTTLTTLTTSLPGTQVLLTTENSLLSTDPTASGLVTAAATTETLVNGSATGIGAPGTYTITVASMPDSIYAGAYAASHVPPAQVIVDTGASQEIVTVTSVTPTTFTAAFAHTHSLGFTLVATMPTAAQAYSYILREAVLSFQGRFPGVTVIDVQDALYGTTAPQTSTLMLNQLHPGPTGRILEADLVASYLLKVRNGSNAQPQMPGSMAQFIGNFPNGFTVGGTSASGGSPGGAPWIVFDSASGTFRIDYAETGGLLRWYWGVNGDSESGTNAGSNWQLTRANDAGVVLDSPLLVNRATGVATLVDGAQVGNNTAGQAQLTLNGAASGFRIQVAQTAGVNRWLWGANATAEAGGNAGSDFTINGYADNGTGLGADFLVNRATGMVTAINGITSGSNTNGAPYLVSNGAAGSYRQMFVETAGVNRWRWGADNTAEGGSNAGSNFQIYAYADAGTSIGSYLTISRATGLANFPFGVNGGTGVQSGGTTAIPSTITGYRGIGTGKVELTLSGTTGTITGTALTASCDSGTATVTGAVVGQPVDVSSTTGADVGGSFYLRASVTSANTVTVYVCGTGTPASLSYNVVVM
jgi:hypothetical protein